MTLYHLKIEIPGLPKTTNAGAYKHWRQMQQQAKLWQKNTIAEIGQKRPIAPCQKARLILTRHSSQEPDFDGLVSSFKHVIDGLIKAQVIANDNPGTIGKPDYRWKRCARNKGFIEIEVSEIS